MRTWTTVINLPSLCPIGFSKFLCNTWFYLILIHLSFNFIEWLAFEEILRRGPMSPPSCPHSPRMNLALPHHHWNLSKWLEFEQHKEPCFFPHKPTFALLARSPQWRHGLQCPVLDETYAVTSALRNASFLMCDDTWPTNDILCEENPSLHHVSLLTTPRADETTRADFLLKHFFFTLSFPLLLSYIFSFLNLKYSFELTQIRLLS